MDVAGSPDIAQTILDKVDASSVFVCDVSPINKGAATRLTPNPNVLIELGYAVRALGWERVIMVFNLDTGRIEDLPFDIRHRRPVVYEAHDASNKSQIQKSLSSTLETAIRACLSLGPRTTEPGSGLSQLDIDLFNRIREMLPADYAVVELRDHDFGNAYQRRLTVLLNDLVWESKQPDFEFLDTELEATKDRMIEGIERFLATSAQYGATQKGAPEWYRVPPDWMHERPDKWREVVKELNDAADEITAAYNELVRTARRKMAV